MRSRLDDARPDAWLVAAGRELDGATDHLGEIANRLVTTITANLGRVRRPGRNLDTDTPGVQVSDRVLKKVLTTRIRRTAGRLVVHLLVDGEDGRVDRIRIGLIARYHDVLPWDSEQVRDIMTDVLTELLGPEHAALAACHLDIGWKDLETHEWSAGTAEDSSLLPAPGHGG
ncbi:hypothetical protein EF294_10160 [Gordonia oryzae]|uniref:Uncharacterized protein n=1 Tax=Gordonia oryzae TaxID=2487349 RepID=A0A3N4GL89_9ACTN|nr:hypothetical protein [Gordonia oryzae]RPA62348.1 hypothetical protein EF294_10160 [Gordonia oryzae]